MKVDDIFDEGDAVEHTVIICIWQFELFNFRFNQVDGVVRRPLHKGTVSIVKAARPRRIVERTPTVMAVLFFIRGAGRVAIRHPEPFDDG